MRVLAIKDQLDELILLPKMRVYLLILPVFAVFNPENFGSTLEKLILEAESQSQPLNLLQKVCVTRQAQYNYLSQDKATDENHVRNANRHFGRVGKAGALETTHRVPCRHGEELGKLELGEGVLRSS